MTAPGYPPHIHEGFAGDVVCHGCGRSLAYPGYPLPSAQVEAFVELHKGHGPNNQPAREGEE